VISDPFFFCSSQIVVLCITSHFVLYLPSLTTFASVRLLLLLDNCLSLFVYFRYALLWTRTNRRD
jgi:hypothetical protein